MKVLFTGMSSSHCKESKNESFFKTISKAYSEFAEVTWSIPKLSWKRSDLENFDEIVFGFAPPTSVGANYLYGAVHVMNLMYESPKFKIVVDSPQMWQYKNSVRAFKRDPDQIFGSFYSSRRDYNEAKNGKLRAEAEQLAQKMATVSWPVTYVPSLPWSVEESLKAKVGFINSESIVPLNLDALLLTKDTPKINRSNQWAVDNINSSWWKKLKATLRYPEMSIKSGKKPKDLEAEERINMCMALAVAPQDRKIGTWWSYRYIQGLNTTTPIVTQWQDTLNFSSEWAYLAYQLEDMEPYERQQVAFDQIRSYKDGIPDRNSAVSKLKNIVDSKARGIY